MELFIAYCKIKIMHEIYSDFVCRLMAKAKLWGCRVCDKIFNALNNIYSEREYMFGR